MNKTRNVFFVLMACVVMLFATACGDVAFKHGYVSGQTYYSDFFGFKITGDAGWQVATDDGLARVSGIKDMSESSIKSALDKGGVMEMKLASGASSITVIVYDNEKFTQYREYQYIDAKIKSIEDEFGQFSTINCDAKKSTIDFLGKLTVCVETESSLRGLEPTYGYDIPVVNGKYTASISLSAPSKQALDSLVKRISLI